jgi:MFS family permease
MLPRRVLILVRLGPAPSVTHMRHGAARGRRLGTPRAGPHPTVWRLNLLSFTLLVGLYSISFWLPQIIKSFSDLDNVEVAILSAMPYIAATVAMVIAGAHSDRSRERCLHIAGAALIGAAGLAASAYVYSPVTGLIALSVATAGIFSAIPIFWSLPNSVLARNRRGGSNRSDQLTRKPREIRWAISHRAPA